MRRGLPERARPLSPLGEGPSSRERQVRLRLMLVGFAICLWAVIVLVRLVQLQVLNRAGYELRAARQSERTIVLDPRRGAILDRAGHPLAVSVDAESIYAVPQEISDPVGTAQALAQALGLDAGGRREVLAQLQKSRGFVWVRRKVDPVAARAVRDLQLEGMGFLTENRRYYPKRDLASQVLGYVGLDNTGMSGIEYAFDGQIRGRAAKVAIQIDARRRAVGHAEKPSTEGRTVVLTLDEAIQHSAERELDKALVETGAVSGVVVVMDPATGEILGLANRPAFNPNRFASYASSRWKNRAVADAYEPGSVFKIFTAAAALQEGVVDPDETIDCGGGFIEIAGMRINDHRVFDQLTFRDVMARSSDVGVVRVAQRLGRESFNRYVREFGFGVATGVELPGESSGLLRPPARWSALSLASLSFGQEIGVTALQIAAATGAVANGGYLMKPYIVRFLEDAAGRVVQSFKPVAVRRVLQPHTVEVLTDLLKGVVKNGTGTRAAVPGYTVAGKTGTAQKIDGSGRYSMADHVASFVGFVPAARPALVILVSLDSPRGTLNHGGDVAAPVFARVAEDALRHLAVPSEDPDRVLRATAYSASPATPAAYHPEASPAVPDPDPALMPDLRGRPAREAAIAAARRGLAVTLKGSGRVAEQSPAPGTRLEPGMVCLLTLSRNPVSMGPEGR